MAQSQGRTQVFSTHEGDNRVSLEKRVHPVQSLDVKPVLMLDRFLCMQYTMNMYNMYYYLILISPQLWKYHKLWRGKYSNHALCYSCIFLVLYSTDLFDIPQWHFLDIPESVCIQGVRRENPAANPPPIRYTKIVPMRFTHCSWICILRTVVRMPRHDLWLMHTYELTICIWVDK